MGVVYKRSGNGFKSFGGDTVQVTLGDVRTSERLGESTLFHDKVKCTKPFTGFFIIHPD